MASSILFIMLLLNVSLWLAIWLIVLLAISLSFLSLFDPAVSRNRIWCWTSSLSWIKNGQHYMIFKELILCSGSFVLNWQDILERNSSQFNKNFWISLEWGSNIFSIMTFLIELLIEFETMRSASFSIMLLIQIKKSCWLVRLFLL